MAAWPPNPSWLPSSWLGVVLARWCAATNCALFSHRVVCVHQLCAWASGQVQGWWGYRGVQQPCCMCMQPLERRGYHEMLAGQPATGLLGGRGCLWCATTSISCTWLRHHSHKAWYTSAYSSSGSGCCVPWLGVLVAPLCCCCCCCCRVAHSFVIWLFGDHVLLW
jgi:hypothetical protein